MSTLEEHLKNIRDSFQVFRRQVQAETQTMYEEGHINDPAEFVQFTELEIDINKAEESVKQHINCKEN